DGREQHHHRPDLLRLGGFECSPKVVWSAHLDELQFEPSRSREWLKFLMLDPTYFTRAYITARRVRQHRKTRHPWEGFPRQLDALTGQIRLPTKHSGEVSPGTVKALDQSRGHRIVVVEGNYYRYGAGCTPRGACCGNRARDDYVDVGGDQLFR